MRRVSRLRFVNALTKLGGVKFEKTEATIAAEVDAIRDAAKERKGGRPKAEEKPTQSFEQVSRGERTTDAARAAMAGTNRQYMHDADRR